jgi:hypothetical protein
MSTAAVPSKPRALESMRTSPSSSRTKRRCASDMFSKATRRLLRGVFALALVPSACGGQTSGEPPRGGTIGCGETDAGVDARVLESGSCEPNCATRADCCTDCAYPNNLECRNRHCVSLGCTGDADCARVDGPRSVCRSVLGVPRCLAPCRSDADCTEEKPVCIGGDAGDGYCTRLPVLQIPCFDDSQCAGKGVCDKKTFRCACSTDDQCGAGKVCVLQPRN